MRKSPLYLFFSFALLLAACGGGGGGGNPLPSGGGGSTPTPTPAPTATPTPSAPPSPLVGPDGVALAGPTKATGRGGWLATAVASALNFPVQHGWYGNGQTVAIVIDSDVNLADIDAYLTYNQTPGGTAAQRITTVAVSPLPAPTLGPSGSQLEATLDVETVAGLAPGAKIRIYEVDTIASDQSLTNAYAQIDSDRIAYIADSSFGGCEFSGSSTQEDPVLATGASHGIAWFASSGDNGNLCNYDSKTAANDQVGPSWPAVNPHVIGVGGNESDYGLGYDLTSPSVWNDQNGAGGGGISDTPSQPGLTPVPIPAYQSSLVSGLLTRCSSPATGSACSSSYRNTPDFSMPAAYDAMYMSGWQPVDGTSWSSPMAAALFAELYEYCGAAGGPISGVTEPAAIPYYAYLDSPNDFIDVNVGNDLWNNSLSPFYAGGVGYDDAGGLGVPNGAALIQTVCPNRTPRSPLVGVRAASALARSSFQVRNTAYPVDISPRVPGLSDEGERPGDASTAIQIVMQPENAQTAEAAVIKALQDAGFRITQTFADHMVVNAEAPSSTVGRYFRTSMHNVWQNGYGTRYMPTTQAVVPAAIAPYAASISLDNVAHERHLHPHHL